MNVYEAKTKEDKMKTEKIIYDSSRDYSDEENLENARYEMFRDNLKNIKTDNYFLLTGKLGLWNGSPSGYKILYNLTDLFRIMSSYDYIRIEQKGNKTFVKLGHHDGTHCMELMELSAKGKKVFEKEEGIDYTIENYKPKKGCWKNVKLYNMILIQVNKL